MTTCSSRHQVRRRRRRRQILQDALGIETDEVVDYWFPKAWPTTASSALASSASGCRPRRASWPDVTRL